MGRPAPAVAEGGTVRPRAELDEIRDRVLAEIRANPSQRPYLGEEGLPLKGRCKRGHAALVLRNGARACRECDRLRNVRRRSGGSKW